MKEFIVLGDLNLDVVLSGMDVPPAFGREILARDSVLKPGGSGANVAMALSMMGAPVRLFSAVGRDFPGGLAVQGLRRCGLSARSVVRSSGFSTGVTVSLAYPNDRMFVTHPAGIGAAGLEDLKRGYIRKGAHLHLSSYFLQVGLQPAVGGLLEKAKAAGMGTSLDPGCDPEEQWDVTELEPFFRHVDWFLPNTDEILALTGQMTVPEALEKLSGDLKGVVVKAGSDGAYARLRGEMRHFPSVPVEAVDTTCAGDCFDAAFLFRLAAGTPADTSDRAASTLWDAVEWANRIGGIAASTMGLPSAEILREEVQK
jgi:sugar/nucleoside kinase (ribokinase family)